MNKDTKGSGGDGGGDRGEEEENIKPGGERKIRESYSSTTRSVTLTVLPPHLQSRVMTAVKFHMTVESR